MTKPLRYWAVGLIGNGAPVSFGRFFDSSLDCSRIRGGGNAITVGWTPTCCVALCTVST